MRLLLLKTWRDIGVRKGQFIALIVLVALGITSYVSFISSYQDLKVSTSESYARLKFEDFATQVLGAPKSVLVKVRQVPGVAAVEGRLVVDTQLDRTPQLKANARIVGVPAGRSASVDEVLVADGSYVSGLESEVLVHQKFANETGAAVGDRLTIQVLGRKQIVRITGLATSPDYLYPVRSKGDFSGPGEFALLYMAQPELERLFHKPDTYTSIAVRLAAEANERRVIKRVEKILKPYGIIESVKRADQPSNFSLQEEIKQNQSFAYLMPMLILTISSLSLAIALSRLVQSQRGEIGLAKALGYRDWQILLHYLMFSMVIALAGGGAGFALGQIFAVQITQLYASLLGIPFLRHEIYPEVVIGSVLLSSVSCVTAGLVPAYHSARMAPARAMHADPNLALAGGKMPIVERLFGWLLPRAFTFKIPLRNVFRARRRSLYTIVGIAFALVLTVTTWSMFDSMAYLLDQVFVKVERWDMLAVFPQNFYNDQPREVAFWRGVKRVQPALMLPVQLKAHGKSHDGVATATEPDVRFHGFDIVSGEPVDQALAHNGLILTPAIAKKLAVKVGDSVSVDTPYIDKAKRLRVLALTDELWGAPIFTSIDEGRKLADSNAQVFNTLYLNVNPRDVSAIKIRLEDLPGEPVVQIKNSLLEAINAYMGLQYAIGGILLAFGWAMAFVVIYNTFTANIIERTREIATMRTIGEDRFHLATMITIENLLLAVVGLPLGVWLGVRAAQALYGSMSSEAFTLKAVVFPLSIVYVVISIVIVLLLSEIPPIRRVFRLDLAEATKFME